MRPAFAVAAFLAASAPLRADAPVDIEALSWLAGCWSMPHENGFTQEFWLPPAGGAMLGIGRTIRAGRMAEHEFLAIREVDGRLAYVARPSGQPQTVFPLVRQTAMELVFENPAHDFPRRIIYRRTPDGIAARIEGSANGKTRAVDFPFRRCR